MLNQESNARGHLDLVKKNDDQLLIRRTEEGLLYCKVGSSEDRLVSLVKCFPWSSPDRYLSLKDDEGNEVYLIESLEELAPENRMAIIDSLREEGFLFEVVEVRYVKKEFELRVWDVVTKQGDRRFQTSLTVWPIELPGERLLVKDVDGDLYLIPDLSGVDKRTREQIWAFIDQE